MARLLFSGQQGPEIYMVILKFSLAEIPTILESPRKRKRKASVNSWTNAPIFEFDPITLIMVRLKRKSSTSSLDDGGTKKHISTNDVIYSDCELNQYDDLYLQSTKNALNDQWWFASLIFDILRCYDERNQRWKIYSIIENSLEVHSNII